MVGDKAADIAATGAEAVLAGDLGCLLNIAGKLSRLGIAGRGAPRRRGAGRHDRRAPPIGAPQATDRCTPTSHAFKDNARAGLGDPMLAAGARAWRAPGFRRAAAQAIERLPEFEALREDGRAIKDHTLAHLDFYLELYERNVIAAGGQVHWARNAAEARAAVLQHLPRRSAPRSSPRASRWSPRRSRSTITSKRTASPRSRPISANTSSSCATSRRATSSRRRST